MCGIAGVFAYRESAPPVDREELLRIRDLMFRRGPDGEGLWISGDRRVGLAHRRLAIIDLSDTGAQPMWNAERTLCVTFNGEIYNYRELRRELEVKGYAFHSQSDTEVLLHLYADRGEAMVHSLRGMYAFAIWDARARQMFLARDPFGIKPLYYVVLDGQFLFASQVKALITSRRIDRSLEPAGTVGFYLWGCVPDPYTIYRGIRALPAGSWLKVSSDAVREPVRFFSIAGELKQGEASSEHLTADLNERLHELMLDSVKHHLVADVAVGVFLSSGLDSTSIAALAREAGCEDLRTITLGFREFIGTENDEAPLADRVAESIGSRHETRWIAREDFDEEFAKILECMDQPSVDGVNTYFVSRAAAQAGLKVAMSGLGGDELFAGYPSYRQIPGIVRLLRLPGAVPTAGKIVRWLTAPWIGRFVSAKFAGLLEYGNTYEGAYLLRRSLFMPWELDEVLDPETIRVGLDKLQWERELRGSRNSCAGARQRVTALECDWYLRNQLLRDADWAGMAHSLEIRVPMVDISLFRQISPLLATSSAPDKHNLARVPRMTMPRELSKRPKTGFGTPVQEWISTRHKEKVGGRGLQQWARQVCPPVPKMFRALVLVSDAYGGKGGIAKFNRDFLAAICNIPDCGEVVALPRIVSGLPGTMPANLKFDIRAAGDKFSYLRAVISTVFRERFDVVIAGHINLSPLGLATARLQGIPCGLMIYGIDAWAPHRSRLVRMAAKHVDCVIGISEVTLERFGKWSKYDRTKCRMLPCAVDLASYTPGPRSTALSRRLGIEGRTVAMTLGRLDSFERYKGFDEVLEVLPTIVQQIPDLTYLICGEGDDRERLERKAADLGIADRVLFTGFVEEEQKIEYYRLADVFVMPSRGEGFGIVFLEAMACGTPVVASLLDGGKEALRNGMLGALVDPGNPRSIVGGVRDAILRGRGVPAGLEYYSSQNFQARAQAHLVALMGRDSHELSRVTT